jgi:hypothetical protein
MTAINSIPLMISLSTYSWASLTIKHPCHERVFDYPCLNGSTIICSLQRRPTLSKTTVQTSDIQRIHGKNTPPCRNPFTSHFQIDRTSPLHAHRHVCHLLRNHLRSQPQTNGRSPLKNVVEILHQLPSSYLRRTMLHSIIVHSAPGGVTAHTAHQGAAVMSY